MFSSADYGILGLFIQLDKESAVAAGSYDQVPVLFGVYLRCLESLVVDHGILDALTLQQDICPHQVRPLTDSPFPGYN